MANLKFNDVLSLLKNVRPTGNGYSSRCPSHDDNKNSLHLARGENDKPLLKCFAGCSFQSIMTALNISTNGNGQYSSQKGIIDTYDYTDENGELLFQSVRFEPKDFLQRRPDGSGGWIWNLKGTRSVLYRLPEISTSDLIYLCEGEKDVETLRQYNLCATCNPMGAGKWREEYNESLRGKTVVILPDNDKPGRNHAEKVANSLNVIAKEIVIVNLPNLPEKGDVTDYFQNGGTIDELIGLVEHTETWKPTQNTTENSEEQISNLFLVKPVNTWIDEAKQRPIPKMLFGEFWFEGELCILFSDTNLGKSILAVQIGESIAIGKEIGILQMTAPTQKILYFDFELSDKQFEARYSIQQGGEFFKDHYHFSEKFYRAEIDPESIVPNGFASFEDFLNISLEQQIAETEATILIVDNITYLRNETEKAKDALPLMKHLKRLKQKFKLSILGLAHTPKRDPTKPLGKNDLQGSRHLLNFCDSAFAIGESHKDKNLRYLKQIKERNTGKIYDAENVMLFQVEKPSNFLQFHYEGFARENEHLKILSDSDREILIAKAKELSERGKSQREIAAEIGLAVGTVNKYLRS